MVLTPLQLIVTQERAQALLAEFDANQAVYSQFLSAVARILEDVLQPAKLVVLSVDRRLKDRDSLEEKLTRSGKHYETLQQVTDIVGLRVVTYYEDDVDTVAGIIDKEFTLVPEHCSDKRYFVEPDRFGYRSLHYVCKLPNTRKNLTEHAPHRDEMFEVQIRSVLQHAWAEIAHKLGYKSPVPIPNEIEHQLSRVAGLLEIADREFKEARIRTSEYRAGVKRAIESNALQNIELNALSYLEFIAASPIIRELDEVLRSGLGYEFTQDADQDYVVGILKWAGITSIDELQRKLQEHVALLKELEVAVFSDPALRALGPVDLGIAVFLLAQILVLRDGGLDRLESLYKEFEITAEDGKNPRESARETSELVSKIEVKLKGPVES